MRIMATLMLMTLLMTAPLKAVAEAVRTDYLQSRLVSQHSSVTPGGVLMLGLLLEHDQGWHTYWQNPGDSGLETQMTVKVAGEDHQVQFLWPLPQRVPLDAQLVNFGYKDRVLLPALLPLPPDLPPGPLQIEASASWLVCEEACIPGAADYALTVTLAAAVQADSRWQADFDRSARRQPREAAAGSHFTVSGNQVRLRMPRALFPGNPSQWVFFPETAEIVRNSGEPAWRRQGQDWVAVLDRNEFFTRVPAQFDWLLVRGDDGIRVSAIPE
ncbi:MAG: protein-disulfide reductase DsbD domain-containing protein [Alcanivoracaceae bacterium]